MAFRLAVEKNSCGKRMPGPAKVDLRDSLGSREPAMVKNIKVVSDIYALLKFTAYCTEVNSPDPSAATTMCLS
jgi:hypothetical protein